MSYEADKSAPLLGAEDQPTLMEAGQQGTIFPTTPGTGMRTSSMQGGATSFLSEAGESIEFLSPNLNQDPYTHPLARNGREDILNNTKHILETIYYVLLAATLPHLILVQLHNRLNIIIQSAGSAEPLRHNDDWHATQIIIEDAKCRFNFVALTVFPLSLYISSLTVFLIQFESLSSLSFAEYFSMTSWTASLWLFSISCYTYYIQNKLESAKQIQRSLNAASDNGWNKCLYGCSRTKVALSVWFPYGAYSLKKEIDLLESVSRVRPLRGLNMDTAATSSSCACTSCFIFSYNGCSNGRLALPEILRIAGYVAAISAVSGSVAYALMIKMTAMFVIRGFPFFKYTVTLFTFITPILCVSFILAYGLDRAKLIVFGIFGRVQTESLLDGGAPSHSSSPVQQAHDNVAEMLMV